MHRIVTSLPLVLVLALALALAACGGDQDLAVEDTPEPEAEEPTEEPVEEPGTEEDATEPDEEGPEDPAEEEQAASPEPDPDRVADPCAEHAGREGEAFLDVVSPVDGQHVAGEFDLVGCASVFEGTVRYRLLDEAGEPLVDDFTTATYGGPELGEFEETIAVEASGEATLEVFWESPEDGAEEDLTAVDLILE